MPKLSIIVPVYRVEQFLDKCVTSILKQTFTDFELILVDDGSPDRCGEMCDEYAVKDKRIKVIHKKNGGLSDARNVGIDSAVGSYLGFVDSDDYIAEDMYEVMIKNLEGHEADISVCGMYDCYGDKILRQNVALGTFEFNREQAVDWFLGSNGAGLFVCNKIYKREIFKDVRFPVGKLYEDAFIFIDLFLKSEKVIVCTEPKYYYTRRDGSTTMSKFNKRYYDVVEAHKKNLEKIIKQLPSKKEVGEFRIFWAYKQLFYILAFDTKENQKKYKNDIKKITSVVRKNFFKIITNKYNSLAQRISYMLIFINPYLFMSVLKNKKEKGM